MSTVDANFRFYSVPEAAVAIGVTDGRVRQLLRAGELAGYKLGGDDGKNWVIPEAAVDDFKSTREKKRQPVTRELARR